MNKQLKQDRRRIMEAEDALTKMRLRYYIPSHRSRPPVGTHRRHVRLTKYYLGLLSEYERRWGRKFQDDWMRRARGKKQV